MVNQGIQPVQISLTEGDFYTLWAPQWREHGADWQAFLGNDEHILVFSSPAQLLAFLESGAEHDLTEHPKWNEFQTKGPERVVPDEKQTYDIVGTPALLAERPSYASVNGVAKNFALLRSLGIVGGDTTIQVFFSSHSILSNPERGYDHFQSPAGLQEWTAIGRVVLDNWDKAVDAADELVELHEVATTDQQERIDAAVAAAKARQEEEEQRRQAEKDQADPYDLTAWAAAGIDPIRIQLQERTVYTLRTFVEAQPVFLGRFGLINVFTSTKAMQRWLIQNTEHDLAELSTWEDLQNGLNTGDVEVEVHPDNQYDFRGITRSIRKGVDAVDTKQMARAYELLADAADWAADDSLNSYFLANPRMQDYIAYMIGSNQTAGYVPTPPFDEHAEGWQALEKMLTDRFAK